jgi:hypothetical protein
VEDRQCLQVGDTAVLLASVRGNGDVVRLLLAVPGIDVNQADKVTAPITCAAGSLMVVVGMQVLTLQV